MATVNNRILHGQIRHAVWLERYKSGTVRKIIALLNRADKDLEAQLIVRLSRIDQRGYDLGKDTTARLRKMLDEIRAQRVELYGLLHEDTRGHLNDLALHEVDFSAKLIETSIATTGAQLTLERPALSLLRASVTARPFQGRLLKDWYASLAEKEGQRLSDAVRIGLTQGQTQDQIMRRVIGTARANYSDGLLEISRKDAAAVVRTAIGHVSNLSSEDLYAANSDIVQGVQVVATLDSHTTPQCRALDGTIYKIGEGPRPPYHWGCRTRTVPYLGETSIRGTRASEVGPVPDDVTYHDWLDGQPDDVQDEILGQARGALFRDGGMTLDRFVDDNGRQYTLDQLKRRDAEIWNKVF